MSKYFDLGLEWMEGNDLTVRRQVLLSHLRAEAQAVQGE